MTAAVSEVVWHPVCERDQLQPERGVAALIDGRQIAIYLLDDGTVRAVDQQDPFSGAFVLSRGIIGTKAGRPVVVSPMLKQYFDLATGQCLDDPAVSIACYPVRIAQDGGVQIAIAR
jgi:nitrite reductase (NADH) small subunit